MPLYQVKENDGPAQPVLRLSGAVDCSTVSVRVNVRDITARSRYMHNLLYNMFQSLYFAEVHTLIDT